MIEQASLYFIFSFGCGAELSVAFSKAQNWERPQKVCREITFGGSMRKQNTVLSRESKGMCVLCVFQVLL